MRTAFGKKAQELRARISLTQTEFAKRIGESLSRVSQLEHGRVSVSDAVVNKYIKALKCDGDSAHALRQFAYYSNSRLDAEKNEIPHKDIYSILASLGDKIKPETARQIRKLIDKDLGDIAPSLKFSNTRSVAIEKKRGSKQPHTKKRPSLDPNRFAFLCVLSEEIRSQFANDISRLNVELFLEGMCIKDSSFNIDILPELPSYAEGAYACIVGQKDGNILLIEEDRYIIASKSDFGRHSLLHEYSHHVLHSELLVTDSTSYLPPTDTSKLSKANLVTDCDTTPIYDVVDTVVEVEAETLATLLLVPWTQMTRSTEDFYLSRDFGEQKVKIRWLRRFLKQPAVVNAIKKVLWEKGYKDHPFFDFKLE
ncbi:MAG: helix-turn-helix transcriptional regulator [Pararhodobacter sp.]|nr:helix-turn-helix transcriptional regulator [Pararhodobacter sp.]